MTWTRRQKSPALSRRDRHATSDGDAVLMGDVLAGGRKTKFNSRDFLKITQPTPFCLPEFFYLHFERFKKRFFFFFFLVISQSSLLINFSDDLRSPVGIDVLGRRGSSPNIGKELPLKALTLILSPNSRIQRVDQNNLDFFLINICLL